MKVKNVALVLGGFHHKQVMVSAKMVIVQRRESGLIARPVTYKEIMGL